MAGVKLNSGDLLTQLLSWITVTLGLKSEIQLRGCYVMLYTSVVQTTSLLQERLLNKKITKTHEFHCVSHSFCISIAIRSHFGCAKTVG